MQKTMRYHIADGENQPVVRAVALVVQREPVEAPRPVERTEPEAQTEQRSQGKTRWIRPALRKAHIASS